MSTQHVHKGGDGCIPLHNAFAIKMAGSVPNPGTDPLPSEQTVSLTTSRPYVCRQKSSLRGMPMPDEAV